MLVALDGPFCQSAGPVALAAVAPVTFRGHLEDNTVVGVEGYEWRADGGLCQHANRGLSGWRCTRGYVCTSTCVIASAIEHVDGPETRIATPTRLCKGGDT